MENFVGDGEKRFPSRSRVGRDAVQDDVFQRLQYLMPRCFGDYAVPFGNVAIRGVPCEEAYQDSESLKELRFALEAGTFSFPYDWRDLLLS